MQQPPNGWPVDGHVHFHSLDLVAPTLDAAARNFRRVYGRSRGFLGAVLLTQAASECIFEVLQAETSVGGWKLAPSPGEPESLIARKSDLSLAITCGRQIRAADGLEVLALGTLETFPDRLPFIETISAVTKSKALTVVPWGFGKWLGERGRRVEEVLTSLGPAELLVGDNGSRLAWAGMPSLVKNAARRGFRVLPGTDPVPFAGGYRRVGQFGFLANIEPSESAPWSEIRNWLLGSQVSPQQYGRATGLTSFVFNQLGIQVYNRLFRGTAG